MKRFGTALFVCLAVQLSTATAPFVHQHPGVERAEHDGEHGRAAVVHRHLASHDDRGDHHDDDQDQGTPPQGALAELTAASAAVSAAAGVMSAQLEARATVDAPVTPAVAIEAPTAGAASPDEDVGGRIPRTPDLASPALRGPPR